MKGASAPVTSPKSLGWPWLVGLSSYWFASSYKWFLLLVLLLPGQVAAIVPGGEKSSYWGSVLAIGAIWAVVGPAIFGNWSDRLQRRKPFIALGVLTTIIALMVCVNANSIWLLAIAYLLIQVSDDIGTGPYSAVLPQLVGKDSRGAASGLLSAAMSAGQIMAIVTAMWLGGKGAPPYLAIVLVTLVGGIATLRSIGAETVTEKTKPPKTGFLEPMRHRDFRLTWLNRFLITLGFYLVVPYAKYYLQDVIRDFQWFGLKIESADTATSILALSMAVSGVLASIAAGMAADRWGRKPVVYASSMTMGIGLLLMVFVRDFTALTLLALLAGGGYGGYQAAAWALAADTLPNPDALGKDMGIWQMSISSVQILAGSAGFLITLGNNMRPGLGYSILFTTASCAVMLSALIVRPIKATS